MTKAIMFYEFGGPEVLQLADIKKPQAGPGQVRIRVRAAGVNPIDWQITHGWMEEKFPITLPSIPGIDVTGVVDQIGEGATDVSLGDEVIGAAIGGAYAEYALVERPIGKPKNMSWEEAASFPTASETSNRVLNELNLVSGETLLINGAAGGVGSFAVQLARHWGATVIGTASEKNHGYLRELGAIPITYGEGLVDRVHEVAPQGVDAVLDVAGKGALPASIELAGGPERVITIADMDAANYDVQLSSAANPSLRPFEVFTHLYREGKLHINVGKTFPLAEADQAYMTSESGHLRGKLVLQID